VGSARYDRTKSDPPVLGLYSNVAEWTMSLHAPYPGVEWPPDQAAEWCKQRIVRGGPFYVVQGKVRPDHDAGSVHQDARFRQGISPERVYRGLGFRCARSQRPRFPHTSHDAPQPGSAGR
jgi:formylglycine-generating enzyme required for sulfatase activity